MVIDTSAIVAILANEPEASRYALAIQADPVRLVSAAILLELGIVLESRFGDAGGRELDLFLYAARVDVVDVTRDQAEIARRAWRAYGKGRHPAGLNYGDCFSYALARAQGEPLLCKGNDFCRTDVRLVIVGESAS
ncbi:MAG: type II toxin-antitoxin system VapC family toxin [Pseudomonadota bacterium]|nr:type II toxin-antitoxin system VapC family toxin [Pseudomonadota bacterium]